MLTRLMILLAGAGVAGVVLWLALVLRGHVAVLGLEEHEAEAVLVGLRVFAVVLFALVLLGLAIEPMLARPDP